MGKKQFLFFVFSLVFIGVLTCFRLGKCRFPLFYYENLSKNLFSAAFSNKKEEANNKPELAKDQFEEFLLEEEEEKPRMVKIISGLANGQLKWDSSTFFSELEGMKRLKEEIEGSCSSISHQVRFSFHS
jgi:hypothetical protein